MTKTEKLTIAQNICAPLLKKIKDDLQRNAYLDDDSVHRLDFRYTTGVASPDRHVRTRLYFTSESHIHSLLTMLTEGGLIDVSDFFCIFLSKVQIAWKEVKKLGLLESVIRHWNSIIGKSLMKGYQVLNMRLCVKP